MKKLILPGVIVVSLLSLALTSCGGTTPTYTATTRVVTDITGEVTIPYNIQRVANNWPANNAIMLMLGAGDKIVATAPNVKGYPWFQKLYPRTKDIPTPFATAKDVNMESLIGIKPDVVIFSKGGLDATILDKIKAANIATVQLYFDNFDNLKTTVLTTGKVLGSKEEAKAEDFVQYMDKNLSTVTSVSANLPKEKRPTVLHTVGANYLGVDGRNTIIDTWIDKAGGTNAAAQVVDGNGKTITKEQLLLMDPDIIIIGNLEAAKVKQDLMTDPAMSNLKAVKNGKVYLNPTGVFSWDRYSAEEALQILWAAKTLHPDLFPKIDMVKEVKSFYSKYFGYNLTDDEANRILNAQPPV